MDILSAVSGDGSDVLVSAAGKGDDDDVIFIHRPDLFHHAGDGVSGLDGTDDAFCFGKVFEGLNGFFIRDSTAWQQPLLRRFLVWSARSSWERSTPKDRI